MPQLAPYAVHDKLSLGRAHHEPTPNYRGEFQRDRDRIVHSAAFRRLEYKTQVFVNHEGDMFRTRLTHSIEVAQIGRSIARIFNINEDLTEAIALAHDLGHTPFGHAGQDALHQCTYEHGGFEHNLQSLRVIDEIEEKYADFSGLNLMYETREGILKHCSQKNAAMLGDVGQRFILKQQPSLEAQVTNIADEIAYNNHDIDDGLRAGLLSIEQLCEVELFREQFETVNQLYPKLNHKRVIHEVIRRMINRQVVDLIETSQALLTKANPSDIEAVRKHSGPLISFSDSMQRHNHTLKQFLRKNLYNHYRVHRMAVKAGNIIRDLYQAFMDDPALLPSEHASAISDNSNMTLRARMVTDYIAGMTDRYAIKEHARLFNPIETT